jgi:hypothetical protein
LHVAINFTVNGGPVSVDVPHDTPLLWVIRERLKLTGTKFGCGVGLCGACMVHVDGKRDEVALKRSVDPMQFRLELLKNTPREQKVLQRVGETADWDRWPASRRAHAL